MKYNLETDRLILRHWTSSDKEGFFELNSDPEVMRNFPKTLTREESDAVADRISGSLTERGWGFWAIELKECGEFIGFTGLNIPKIDTHFTPCVEIGWRLKKEFWNKGYASEAAAASLEFGFDVLKLEEIIAMTAVQNIPSRKVMEKIGMTYDPKGDFDHPMVPQDSHVVRHVLYRIKLLN